MNILFYDLDKNKFNKFLLMILHITYDILAVKQEGINRVKKIKINFLVYSYELFKMKSSESISDIHICFTYVVNELKFLNKNYTNLELIIKILRYLP